MESSISVRVARPSDIPVLRKLFREGDELHQEWFPWLITLDFEESEAAEVLLETLSEPNSVLFLAEKDGKGVGAAIAMANARPIHPLIRQESYLLLDTIVVADEHRQQGIGWKLYETVLAWGKDRGLSRVELKVYHPNAAARAMYEKAGFEPVYTSMSKPI